MMALGLAELGNCQFYKDNFLYFPMRCTYELSICIHCINSVRIRSYSGQYSVWMLENTEQNNSECDHFSPSDYHKYIRFILSLYYTEAYLEPCQIFNIEFLAKKYFCKNSALDIWYGLASTSNTITLYLFRSHSWVFAT